MESQYLLAINNSLETIRVEFEHCSENQIWSNDINYIDMVEHLTTFFRKSLNL